MVIESLLLYFTNIPITSELLTTNHILTGSTKSSYNLFMVPKLANILQHLANLLAKGIYPKIL